MWSMNKWGTGTLTLKVVSLDLLVTKKAKRTNNIYKIVLTKIMKKTLDLKKMGTKAL